MKRVGYMDGGVLQRSPKMRKIIEEAALTSLFILTMLTVPFVCMALFNS